MPPVVAAVAAIGSALSAASMAIGGAVGLSGIAAGVVGGSLVGAALGAATSAIVGGDIKKGALLGAIGGAVSGGFAGAKALETAKTAASGFSGAASNADKFSLAAMPEQIGGLGAQAGAGTTGAYTLGGEGILSSMAQIGDQVAPLAGQAAGVAGQAGGVSPDMAAFLQVMKESSANQTKWMMGTEAVKMGAGALLDTSKDDALELQRRAIEAQKVDLTGVNAPNVRGRFEGTNQTGSVSSSLGRLREQGLLGGADNLNGRRINYATRTA